MANYPKITSRKIKYNSPSGYANIGKYIPPFENNDTGFGFKGVVIEDSKNGKIECSVCGKWFSQVSHSHLETHGLTATEYKRKFGLLTSTALKSKQMRINQSKVMIELRKNNKNNRYSFKRGNSYSANRKGNPKSVESKNKFGVCELQILERVKELAQELGKTPTLIDLKNRYGWGIMASIHSTYGSYIKVCNRLGLTANFSNYSPKYSREYFLEKALSNEPSFRIFTRNESRALYRWFKSIKELQKEARRFGSKWGH
jgi:hypothetical protein